MNERAQFANDVCKLIWDVNDGHIENTVKAVKPFYDHFSEHVRNIYELTDQIPLFYLYELYNHKDDYGDNYGIEENQYIELTNIVTNMCVLFYELDQDDELQSLAIEDLKQWSYDNF
jgi:hypothetical protein